MSDTSWQKLRVGLSDEGSHLSDPTLGSPRTDQNYSHAGLDCRLENLWASSSHIKSHSPKQTEAPQAIAACRQNPLKANYRNLKGIGRSLPAISGDMLACSFVRID